MKYELYKANGKRIEWGHKDNEKSTGFFSKHKIRNERDLVAKTDLPIEVIRQVDTIWTFDIGINKYINTPRVLFTLKREQENKYQKEVDELIRHTFKQGRYYEWTDMDIQDEFRMSYDIELTDKEADKIADLINDLNQEQRAINKQRDEWEQEMLKVRKERMEITNEKEYV